MKCKMESLVLLLLLSCSCRRCFIGCCDLSAIDVSSNLACASAATPAATQIGSSFAAAAALADVLFAYFQHHGVHSLMLVICPEDIVNAPQRKRLLHLLQRFNAAGFYTRIFNGHDYEHDSESTLPSLSAYGPPRTFRRDNSTRLPLRLQLQPLAHKSGILMLQFSTGCALNVLRWSAAPEHNFFTTNRFWLLLTEAPQQLSLLADEEIFVPPDSELRVLLQTAAQPGFSLIDVYKVAAEKPPQQRLVGAQLRGVPDMLRALQQFGSAISYRHNLEGITFKTGLVIAFPDMFTQMEDLSMRHIDTISKVNHQLTVDLARKLNMRFNTHQTDNFGWHQPNGSFDGLMGRFQRYELDFAQHAIFMRLERLPLCDFVVETFRIRAGLMFRQPPLSAVANIFAMPFGTDVWLSILALIVLTAGVFTVELLFSPQRHEMHVLDCVGFVWGAICQQSFYLNVGNISARAIVFTTFVATVFLFTSFSANIVALLQSPSEAIHSMNDLTQSPLEIGVQDTVYNTVYFNESTDPVTNRFYHRKIAPKGASVYMRPQVGMEKMRTSLFAYQVELQAGYQIISDTFSEPEKCGLMELEPFQLPMIGIPTRKNFPYKELFRRLRWQREVGLMNREERKWFPQKPKCESGVGGFVSIGLTECRYNLAMFGCGILLAVLTFGFELLLNHLMQAYARTRRVQDRQRTVRSNRP